MENKTRIVIVAVVLYLLSLVSCTNQNLRSNNIEVKPPIKTNEKIPAAEPPNMETHNEITQDTPSEPIAEPVQEDERTDKEIWLDNQINTLTLEQKIGQLFICAFRKDENNENIYVMNSQIEEAVLEYNIGGVIFFAENIDTLAQTTELIKNMQTISQIPLFISIDEEGGRVSRLNSNKTGFVSIPTAKKIAEAGDINYTSQIAETLGKELYDIGFNMNFAPVADIFTNPENKVIGDRAFGSEPDIVMENVAAMVKGLQTQNIMSVIKHFPGHGDTKADTHSGTVISENNYERLLSVELLPFAKGINENCTGVMVSHITLPNIDENNPVTFSSEMVTGVLREELNFDGLIITDSLSMGAITYYYSSSEAAVSAFNAGADILLMPQNYKEAFAALMNEVESGSIDIAKIDESVIRILSAKYDYLISNDKNISVEG